MRYEFKVLGARCIVTKDKPEDITKAGIILPGQAQEETYMGTVIAVGTGHMTESGMLIPVSLKEGDRVVFAKFAGTPLKSGSKSAASAEEYLVLNERDVIAIVTEIDDTEIKQ